MAYLNLCIPITAHLSGAHVYRLDGVHTIGFGYARAVAGRYIGAEEISNGIWNVYYRDVLLGYMDEKLITEKETYLHINKIKV